MGEELGRGALGGKDLRVAEEAGGEVDVDVLDLAIGVLRADGGIFKAGGLIGRVAGGLGEGGAFLIGEEAGEAGDLEGS